jgi:hypothetical protein
MFTFIKALWQGRALRKYKAVELTITPDAFPRLRASRLAILSTSIRHGFGACGKLLGGGGA